jgi:predicted DNA binding CopG/RHH family protein
MERNMATRRKVIDADAAWDARELGQDARYAKKVNKKLETNLEAAMGFRLISIRMQKKLLDDLKFIAVAHNIGYQPLIRDVLSRFVDHEKKEIIRSALERQDLERRTLEQEQSAKIQKKKAA